MQAKLALIAAMIGVLLPDALWSQQPNLVRPERAFDFLAEGAGTPTVVTAVAVSGDGSQIAASGDDHHIRLWNIASGEAPRVLQGHRDWVRDLAFDPAGGRLASVADDRAVILWDTQNLQPLLENQDARGPLGSVAFLAGGHQLLTAAYGDRLRLMNTSSGYVDKQFACPCRDTRVMALSPTAAYMAAGGRNGAVRLWDLTTGEEGKTIPADTRRIQAIAFSPDGAVMATGGDGPVVRLWDVATGDLAGELPMRPSKTRAMRFLSDGRLAVGGTDNQIHLWDTTRKLRTHRLVGHTGTVAVIAHGGAGGLLATAGFDTTIMLWRVPDAPRDVTAQADGGAVR